MKNIGKYIGVISTVVFSVLMFSCTEKVEYSQAEKLTGAQVYFSSLTPSQIDLDREATSYSIKLMRGNTDGNLTVELKVESETDKLDIPTSVEFQDGENVANVNVTYSLDELGYDNYYKVKIALTEDTYTTPYGPSSLDLSLGIPAPWVTLGKATYQDDVLLSIFGLETKPYKLDIQQNGVQKNQFRLVNPFGKDYPMFSAIEGQYDTSKNYYMEFSVSEDNKVIIKQGELGVSVEQGTIGIATLKEGSMTKDSIITFPVNGLAFTINGELWNYVNTSGNFKLAFPSTELSDYTLGVSYAGKYTTPAGVTEGVIAELSKVGEDIDNVSLAVIEGNDEVIDTTAVLKQAMEVSFNSDNLPASFVIPFKDKTTGFYTIVAIAQAGDKVCSLATSVFKYNEDVKEVWIDKYKGTYNYAFLTDQENNPAVEENLIMSQNQENPSLWRISGSEAMDDFTFIYNEDDNQIYVNESTLLGGTLYVTNSVDDEGLPIAGNKSGDTYTFKVNYYDPYGNYGDYEETFVITGYATEGSTYKSVGTRSFDSFVKKQINSYKSFKKVSIPFAY